MSGSAAIAGWIAQVAFWTILGLGTAFGEIHGRSAALFLLFWIGGVFALPHLLASSGPFVTPYVAVLDVVLALVVFKGNVRLS